MQRGCPNQGEDCHCETEDSCKELSYQWDPGQKFDNWGEEQVMTEYIHEPSDPSKAHR